MSDWLAAGGALKRVPPGHRSLLKGGGELAAKRTGDRSDGHA